MHVARGGWLGQTFALAKFDDYFEGKKSGIRRSKEERKGMIEGFIKRYQKSNNGDFPSLNLTRKEVGGSFYTVREIVREIIQENRVLGPPKSPPGDQNIENLECFLDHYPSGSVSVDRQEHSPNSNETDTQPEYAFISEKVLHSSSTAELHQGKSESFEKVDGLHEIVANQTQNDQILEDVDKNMEEERAHSLQESKSTLENQTGQDPSSTKENLAFDVNGNTNVKLQDTLVTEQKLSVNGANDENLQSKTSCNPVQESAHDGRSSNSNQSGAGSQNRRTNETLNRVDLKSWKAAGVPRKSDSSKEAQQLVRFIRSFITAFVKFWSE